MSYVVVSFVSLGYAGYIAAADVPQHVRSKRAIEEFLSSSKENRIAVTDDVLLEFIHVVTDPKRLRVPLSG